MGAWGTEVFDNDTACDWAYMLEESDDLSVVEVAFEKVISAGSELRYDGNRRNTLYGDCLSIMRR